jgi:hypothetical protein
MNVANRRLMNDFDDIIIDTIRHDFFRVLYKNQKNDINMNEKNKIVFDEARKQLREHCFVLTQIVIITIFNVENYALFFVYEFDFIIVNKTSRFLKINT